MDEKPIRPRQAGELAVLSYPYVPKELAGCETHVFRVEEPEPTRVYESQSGYLQRAVCLVCGKVSPRLDASWWLKAPTSLEVPSDDGEASSGAAHSG